MELVRMPKFGMTMESAEILGWLVKESATVNAGEPIVEVQTEKATLEVEAPSSGILAKILATKGEDVPVGAPIAVIAAPNETIDPAAIEALLQSTPSSGKKETPVAAASTAAPAPQPAESQASPGRVRATPRVRKLAQELGVNLAEVQPTGPGGSLTEDDVRRHAAGSGRPRVRERVPLTGLHKAMATHILQSWQSIPHFHQIIDVDARALLRLREKHPVTFSAFFVRAAAIALERHPWINATIEGNEAILYEDVNVGVAVATDAGLVVPVIRQANQKSVEEIAADLQALSERARAGKLSQEDLSGGTFTVSNLGMYGIETGTPIINAPQVALMFVGALQSAPAFEGGEVVERQFWKVTLSYDHRLIDGVRAAAFSQEIRQLLQSAQELGAT